MSSCPHVSSVSWLRSAPDLPEEQKKNHFIIIFSGRKFMNFETCFHLNSRTRGLFRFQGKEKKNKILLREGKGVHGLGSNYTRLVLVPKLNTPLGCRVGSTPSLRSTIGLEDSQVSGSFINFSKHGIFLTKFG